MGAAKAAGLDDERFHREFFGMAPAQEGGGAFRVKLSSTGRVINVVPQTTVIAALANMFRRVWSLGSAGVEVPSSCEQGVSGTCLTRVLSGEPDHRDAYLTDDEKAANDQFLPCCSRSRSPVLVLDL